MTDDNISFFVIAIFVLLFFVFINTQPEITGEAIYDDLSALSIVIAIIVVIIVLLVIFFILRKIKRRKLGAIPSAPKPASLRQENLTGLNVPSAPVLGIVPAAPSSSAKQGAGDVVLDDVKLNEEELSSLFKEPVIKEEAKLLKEAIEKEESKIEMPELTKGAEEKTLANLSELKNLISKLVNKNYNKEKIVKFLQSKGWSALQINKAVEELNNDNLRRYVKEARQIGMNNEQIVKSLIGSGWKLDIIKKILSAG